MGISRQTVLEFVAGDKQAIEKVYLEYKNLMFFVIANYVSSKSDIDDILSESFIKAMEKVKDVDEPSYPDRTLTVQENVNKMLSENEVLVKDLYEKVYKEKLTYLPEEK